MDEKPDQIINHIEQQRDQLGRNLNELETRVRRSTDWRTYYERNPMMILGAALGGGVLLGATLGGGSDRSSGRYYKSSLPKSSGKSSSASFTGTTPQTGGTSGSASYGSPSGRSHTPASSSTPASSASPGGSSQQGFAGMNLKTASWSDSPHVKQITETLDQVKGALITFGIAKAKEFLAQAVPGLEEHLGNFAHGGHQQRHEEQNKRENKPENRPQAFGDMGGQESRSGIPSSQFSESSTGPSQPGGTGTGMGANDYRSSNKGFTNAGPTGAGDQYAGAGSGRNPNVTP